MSIAVRLELLLDLLQLGGRAGERLEHFTSGDNVHVRNDANAAALEELFVGALKICHARFERRMKG